MLRSPIAPSVARRPIVVAVCGVAVLLAAFGVWLAVQASRQTGQPSPPAARAVPQTNSDTHVASEPAPAALEQLPVVADPEAFATATARALFDWDTTAPYPLSDYTGRLLAVADPTGQESPGLAADLASYLPTPDAWAFLKPYYTRQWLEISSIEVPDLWAQALAEAGPSGLPPGTAAYTIRGTRHRSGLWEGDPVMSAHDVAFTVFVVCAPSYPSCHLLRLSRLDEPLE